MGLFRRLPPWVPLALILLFTAGVRLRLLQIPLERDEGEYAYAGQLMLQGIPPYLLAANMKFPGTYAAYAIIMVLFGQTIGGIHFGFLLMNAGTIVMIYFLGKRLFGDASGVAAAAAYALLSVSAGVMGTQAHATHFVVAAAVGGMLLLLRAIENQRWLPLFLAGVLFAVATLMKQHGAFLGVFAALYLAGRRRSLRQFPILAAGACVPLALTGLALWRAGVFGKFWFWTVRYAGAYTQETSLRFGWVRFTYMFPAVAGPSAAIWILAAAGLALAWWNRKHRTAAFFLTGLLIFSFLAICPGLYFREHYFVLMLPAVALLAGGAIEAAAPLL